MPETVALERANDYWIEVGRDKLRLYKLEGLIFLAPLNTVDSAESAIPSFALLHDYRRHSLSEL